MTQIFKARYARDLYHEQLQTLVDFGEPVDVRGRKTIEILNAITEIEEPWHHCILLPSRRWNPWLALSEALWILAGRNDIQTLLPYNQRILDFSDDGVSLYGAYGARIHGQIDILINRLRKDNSDRRAVLQIWDTFGNFGDQFTIADHLGTNYPHQDLWRETKDPPCNNLVYFKLRDNKLHMTVICRSNDIHWGLYAVNLPTFGILQEYIAARLGVGIGTQTHLSNSLHVYTDNPAAVEITERMLYKQGGEDRPPYPKHELCFDNYQLRDFDSHNVFSQTCSDVLDDNGFRDVSIAWPKFLQFAQIFLKQYRERNWQPSNLPYAEEFADWITAGDIFVQEVWNKKKPVNA